METAMEHNPTEFRDRLLDVQPMNPALRDEYRKALDELVNHRLTPRGRSLYAVGAVVWTAAAGACVWSAFAHHSTPRADAVFWINLTVYFMVFVLLALGSIRNAWTGAHTWRAYFHVAGMFYVAAGITVTLALLRGLRAPHDPASTF